MKPQAPIRTQRRLLCPVCGAAPNALYAGLPDRLFGTPGTWDMQQCSQGACGTLWLDPMPAEADLPLLYEQYFTHPSAAPAAKKTSLWRAYLQRAQAGYLARCYQYPNPDRLAWLLGLSLHAYPALCDLTAAKVFYLPHKPHGRLLEIGCGSGAALEFMHQQGWQVCGLDFDPKAAAHARSRGLDVRHGTLQQQGFAAASFDAIAMSHVVEHLPDAAGVLRECHRLLKPGGYFVAMTPNAAAALHRRYGRHWVALDAPRHLQLYTPAALAALARQAGFEQPQSFTTSNGLVFQYLASNDLASGREHRFGQRPALLRFAAAHLRALGHGWMNRLRPPSAGGELVLRCQK